jgi:uncharacterized RDD family membrane protein YckC
MASNDYTSTYRSIGERVALRTSSGKLLFKRWLGCWIDFIALALVFAVPLVAMKAIGFPMPVIACADLALLVLYFPIAEGLWGRSVGKLIAGTIVVDDKGRPPGVGRAAVRTLLRLVEVNPFLLGGLPAGIVSMNTKANQRIGDLLAGTYVVPLAELRQAQKGGDDREAKAVAEHFA